MIRMNSLQHRMSLLLIALANAVSMTSSIEMAFGSTVMVNGYILNNQLTDFSLSPRKKR